MTDKEMAEEYVKKEKFVCRYDMEQTDLDEISKEAFIAGLEAGRPKWHNLRKNPKDVPLIEGRYPCILDYRRTHNKPVVLMYADDRLGHFVWVADDDDIYDGCISRWAEIPKFEEGMNEN